MNSPYGQVMPRYCLTCCTIAIHAMINRYVGSCELADLWFYMFLFALHLLVSNCFMISYYEVEQSVVFNKLLLKSSRYYLYFFVYSIIVRQLLLDYYESSLLF